MSSGRLEAFSDGVFAVAATLLVFQLHVPTPEDGDLGQALLSQWPSYVAYAVSFMTIGVIWVNHHALFQTVRHVDRALLLVNLFLLLAVSTIPFASALLGRYIIVGGDASHLAAAVYGAVMLLMSLAFTALQLHVISAARLAVPLPNSRGAAARAAAGLLAYLIGIGLAFFSAPASLLVYGLVAAFYVLPSRLD